MTRDMPADDAAFVGVPLDSVPPGSITPPESAAYLAADSPSQVVDRADRLAVVTQAQFDDVQRKILWLYSCAVVVFVVLLGLVGQNIERTHSNCVAENARVVKQNATLDALIDTPGIKPATKAARRAQFDGLYDKTVQCAGIWPFQ